MYKNSHVKPLNQNSAPRPNLSCGKSVSSAIIEHIPLIGNESVPKNVAAIKNWSSNTFQPITTPPC